ncbi:MAG: N-methyl-L-tryptophan oxidase, partial [Cyanobacteria bacterium P01_F01_bin.143]
MAQIFDSIVLGAGGMGSASAYYLAASGQKVLLLDQFEINHKKGSSYGLSRVIRYAYDNPSYIELMRAAYPLWLNLEKKAGEKLYLKTGGLDFGYPSQKSFQTLKQSMDRAKLDYEYLKSDEVSQRFPQFCLDDGMEALFQSKTGLLRASRCVLAHIHLAQKLGAKVVEHSPVKQIIPSSHSVEIKTATDTYYAERLVITAGSWTKALLASLDINIPLKIMPCQLGFYQTQDSKAFKPGSFPIFLAHMNGDYGEMPYGIPHEHENFGLKISTFYGWKTIDDPVEINYATSIDWLEKIRNFLRQYIPRAAGNLISTRRCLYTVTPDKNFIIDSHPNYSHIVFGAGFSGHGFKFTTLVGKILAQLALEGTTEYDI